MLNGSYRGLKSSIEFFLQTGAFFLTLVTNLMESSKAFMFLNSSFHSVTILGFT